MRKLQSNSNAFELWTEVEMKFIIILYFHRSRYQKYYFHNLCHKDEKISEIW